MLKDYFLFEITDDGLVESLPLLLKGYVPNLDKLPLFLMRLGPQVCPTLPTSAQTVAYIEPYRSTGIQRLNASRASCGNSRTSMSLNQFSMLHAVLPHKSTMKAVKLQSPRCDGKSSICYFLPWRSTWPPHATCSTATWCK